MAARAYISLKTKLAAALLTMVRPDEAGNLVPFIPHEHAKLMSDDQIISLFQFDHDPIPHAPPFNGPDEAWNLTPRPIMEHRTKTAKRDVPVIAKTKRIARAHSEFCARALGVVRIPKEKRSRFPKGRKIPKRPFQKRQTMVRT